MSSKALKQICIDLNFHTYPIETTEKISVRSPINFLLDPAMSNRNFSQIGIIWCHGQNWIDVRRFTKKILKEFGYGKVKIMDRSLNDSANQLVGSIKIDLLDSSDGTFFVDAKKFSVHVLNVLWNLAGGYKFDPNDENLKQNMECVDKVDQIFGHSNPYNMFPFLKTWFPKRMRHAEHITIHNEIHEFTEVNV